MTVELTNDFFAIIDVETEFKNRNNPLQVKNGKITESNLVEDKKYTYFFKRIETNDEQMVVHAKHLPEFIELLNCFVSSQLNIKKKYGFKYKNGGGFDAKITQDDGEKFLAIQIEDNTVYLDKYSCRVLSSKLSKIMAKCDFDFYFLEYT